MSAANEKPADLLIMGRHLLRRWGGVYEVLVGLLGALGSVEQAKGRTIKLLLPKEANGIPLPPNVRPVILSRWGRSRLLWDHATVPAYARTRPGSVLYNPGIVLPLRLAVPAVVSIHDMAYFPPPELGRRAEYLHGEAWYMRRMIRRSLNKAPAVHVPSESTRREAMRLFPATDRERMHVWPYGVDVRRWSKTEDDAERWERLVRRGVTEPYLIYAGGLSRRKNVGVLLDAYLRYRQRRPEMRLVLAGGSKQTILEDGLSERLQKAERDGGVVRVGAVTPDELRLLYARSTALVYPSLYEGFGFPPLEAQAAGCPVICSNSTSLPEVVGDAALLFDPGSADELLERLGRLEQPGLRERLIERGRSNAAKKTWDAMAVELLKLADELLGVRAKGGT